MNHMVSMKEACEILGISMSTILRHVKSGLLPSYKLGGKRMISSDAIDAILRKAGR